MAGYVKVWTTIKSNEEFLSLTLIQRGAWYEILVDAKLQRDDGTVVYRNKEAMGHSWGCEGKTAWKILGHLGENTGKIQGNFPEISGKKSGHFQEKVGKKSGNFPDISLLTYSQNDSGVISINIPKYNHWQELNVKSLVENSRKKQGKIPPLRPEHTIPNQSRPQHFDPHEDYLEFIKKEEHRIRDFLSMIEFRVIGSAEKLWDNEVVGKICPWIRADKDRATHSLNTKHARSWMHFIETWMRGALRKYREELDKTRGMSLAEENQHFRKKERSRSDPSDAQTLGEVLKAAKVGE